MGIMSDCVEPPGGDEPVICHECGAVWPASCDCEAYCPETGELREECPCQVCYFGRHGEPPPCRQCGGVGSHLFGCH